MPVTQQDIANKAQVSRSLVARILSGDPSVSVSASKRQHILETARAAGYKPNSMARNLRSGKTYAVVAICQYDEAGQVQDFTHGVLETLAASLAQAGYELKVRAYQNIADIVAGINEIASTSACDAFVLWLENEKGELPGDAAAKRGLPFVIFGHYEESHPDWHQVDFDHALMMREAVQYLIDGGHRRIAYLGFDGMETFVTRLQSGYKAAMLDLTGSAASEQWIYRVDNNRETTEAVVEQWLELPPDEQPTGVVIGAGTDAWLGIELALSRRGRRIGLDASDLAVVGQHPGSVPLIYGQALAFDNIDMGRLSSAAADILKQQLLGTGTPQRITRLVPALAPVQSLNLPLPYMA